MSVPLQTSRVLERMERIRHGFFGRRGGFSTGPLASLNMSDSNGDKPAHVAENRAQALGIIGFSPDALVTIRQTHSTVVRTLTARPVPGDRPEADAMVTNLPGLALGILTADCAPILLVDHDARVIGAAHAGWKGAVNGIIGTTVDAMQALGASPENIVASIGPTISMPNYEVGPEFTANLLKLHRDAENRIWLAPNGGSEHFDLPGFIFDQLHDAGVGIVDDLQLCTYAEPKHYFSHRYATHAGATTGRQIALIGLA